MPSNDRLRRHKRRNAPDGVKPVIEPQLGPVDSMEESQILGVLPTQLTEIDLKTQTTMEQACDSGSTQSHRDARKSGDHRNDERLAPQKARGTTKDASKLKDNEIRKKTSQGNLMAEDGPWNSVSLSSDEERSGWTKINPEDYEPGHHAVSDTGHDVSQDDVDSCFEDDYVDLVDEEVGGLDDEWTSLDV